MYINKFNNESDPGILNLDVFHFDKAITRPIHKKQKKERESTTMRLILNEPINSPWSYLFITELLFFLSRRIQNADLNLSWNAFV